MNSAVEIEEKETNMDNPLGVDGEAPSLVLLPCPFCGANAGIAQTDKGVDLGLPKNLFVLACTKCETGWSNIDIEALITKWNTRSSAWQPASVVPPIQRFIPGRGDVPRERPYVLAVDAQGRMSVGYATEHSGEVFGYRWTFAKPIGQVTHWQPLPTPPEQKPE